MKNNKGFTLIELLATISLLAILMLIAVPNVIGVVNRNKNNTYVEDAKKLVALAEYKIRSDSQNKPANGSSKCFSMSFLGTGDFDTTAPNGGTYVANSSYVKATRDSQTGEITYRVVLVEKKKDKEEYIGIIKEVSNDDLYKDDIFGIINSTTSLENGVSKCG